MLAFDILAISDFYFTWESFAYMLIGLLLLPQFENPFTKRFLIWLQLLILPRCCSRGHEWKFSNGNDKENGPASEEDDEKAPKHKRCNYKKSWRDHGDLPFYMPASMTPSQYLRTLYWFSSDAPQKQVLKETGLAQKTWAKIRDKIRDLLWLVI